LAVKTFVRERSDAEIKEAVMREMMRGGQVYFLHNDVDSIEQCAEKLQALLPDASIGIAHGQLRERDLERIMRDFYHQRFHILVCSTIIETGIDVPSANTIIIERADKFGLAQLHQLRGRVGRSHHQAYCYLMTPPKALLTADAEKRLEAISAFDDLGAGFLLASQDLEIRGAGELLGEEQSGQIEGLGLSLYLELLEEAVKALKEGREPTLQSVLSQRTEIESGLAALLPDDYVSDIGTRLSLYKRIAGAQDESTLDELITEVNDRFGALPTASKNLFELAHFRVKATALHIKKIELLASGARIEFLPNAPIDTAYLIQLVQKQSKRFRFDGPQHLRLSRPVKEEAADRMLCIDELLRDLAPVANAKITSH
jgi:transcription-repair coupling factor (superfamily II helicase)